jgi:hypothetical protein
MIPLIKTSHYFREHMAERDLLFQDAIAAQLKSSLQATDLPQKLQAIPEKSPDLLGVMLKEGKV